MVAPSAAGLAGLPLGREAMIRKILIGLILVIAIPVVWFATLGRAPEDPSLQPAYDATRAATPPPKAPTPRDDERNAFFGDLHIHSRLSLDAYRFGVTAGPEDAYVFAKGGAIDR